MLAAARYGLTTVILPRRNEADLEEVAEAVRARMNFILVDTVDEVLEAALLRPGSVPQVEVKPLGAAVAATNKAAAKRAARKPGSGLPAQPAL